MTLEKLLSEEKIIYFAVINKVTIARQFKIEMTKKI